LARKVRKAKRARRAKASKATVEKKGNPGPKGERGDFAYVGPKEIMDAAQRIRNEHIAFKARLRATVDEQLASAMPNGPAGDIIKRTLHRIKNLE
jgi:hypothetical protein